jgi:hypothetical protein
MVLGYSRRRLVPGRSGVFSITAVFDAASAAAHKSLRCHSPRRLGPLQPAGRGVGVFREVTYSSFAQIDFNTMSEFPVAGEVKGQVPVRSDSHRSSAPVAVMRQSLICVNGSGNLSRNRIFCHDNVRERGVVLEVRFGAGGKCVASPVSGRAEGTTLRLWVPLEEEGVA